MRLDTDAHRRLLAERRARGQRPDVVRALTDEWFPEERAFFDDASQLAAAECGRRAGKTRGVARDLLRDALIIPGYRSLYLNSTREEARRLAWVGNRGDGIATLIERQGIAAELDHTRMTVRIPATDGQIRLTGADDETELRKALGGAYHKVYWDEAQKIPPKLGQSIREVFFPTLLDFGGKFRMTGTPVRQMVGLFWDVTRPEIEKRLAGWNVYHWTLLDNPFFGRTREERWKRGMLGLQTLLGGPDIAPLDSPMMRREGLGQWVREDANYVYSVHKVKAADVLYAPARKRPDGFPDIPSALADLPFKWQDGTFSLGADLGYNPDPFAFVLNAWHGKDPKLYEVCSWKRNAMTSDQQAAVLREVRAAVPLGQVVADAAGGGKPVVTGWSQEWVQRYNLPILEAEKAQKYTAITMWNNDIETARYQFRDGGELYAEMSQLQWSSLVTGTGRLVEDPTIPNDVCDAGLYSHRHSYQYRWRPEETKPPPGSVARLALEAEELEADIMEEYAS